MVDRALRTRSSPCRRLGPQTAVNPAIFLQHLKRGWNIYCEICIMNRWGRFKLQPKDSVCSEWVKNNFSHLCLVWFMIEYRWTFFPSQDHCSRELLRPPCWLNTHITNVEDVYLYLYCKSRRGLRRATPGHIRKQRSGICSPAVFTSFPCSIAKSH